MRTGKNRGNRAPGKKSFGDFFRQAADDPGGSYIQIFGSRTVTVEGCQGVLSYSGERVKLSMGARSFAVIGSDLTITGMHGSSVTVEGHICGTEFR